MRLLFPGAPTLSQTHGDTRRNDPVSGGQVPSPGISSCSNRRSLPVRRGQDTPLGVGGAEMHSRGAPGAGASSLSWALPAPACPGGSAGARLCPPRPGLSGLRPPSSSQSPAAPSARSRRLSCSRGPAGLALQPLTELGPRCGALSPGRTSPSVPPGTWSPAAPPGIPPGSLLSAFRSVKDPVRIFKVPAAPGRGLPTPKLPRPQT